MEEFDFSKIFSEEMHIKEINSKTLGYRINSFLKACNIDLKDKEYDKILKQYEHVFTRGLVYNYGETDQFTIYAVKQQDQRNGDYVHMYGYNKEFSFAFDNYYENRKLDKKIVDIPFNILIKFNNINYGLRMETVFHKAVSFMVTKDIQDLTFYNSVVDFEQILDIVSAFVTNPEEVYRIYSRIYNQKRIHFSTAELSIGTVNGEKFEKPSKKYVKKINDIK